MAGISSKAAPTSDCGCPNNKGFNGNEIQNKEFSDASGLEVYDFNARTYDQQIGRFIQVDPLLEVGQESLTPYQFGFDNPIRYNDPDGKCPICPFIPVIIEGAKAVGAAIVAGYAAWKTHQALEKMKEDNGGTLFNKDNSKLSPKSDTPNNPATAKDKPRELIVDGNKYPEAAQHVQDAIDNGVVVEGKVDRPGSPARRREKLKDVKTENEKDRDEVPPAVIDNGDGGSSVRLIPPGDNRGAGASLGRQLTNVPDGTRVVLKPINLKIKPKPNEQ